MAIKSLSIRIDEAMLHKLHRSNSKVLHIANAIKNGIFVANLAKANLTGPLSIFEGRDNIFATFGFKKTFQYQI